MSTPNATPTSTSSGSSNTRHTHECRKCKDATVHAYSHPKGLRVAMHFAKIAGSICTLGIAFPHEFATPEVPGRCTKCGTSSILPYA